MKSYPDRFVRECADPKALTTLQWHALRIHELAIMVEEGRSDLVQAMMSQTELFLTSYAVGLRREARNWMIRYLDGPQSRPVSPAKLAAQLARLKSIRDRR